jgi:hypothetical protein
LTWGDQLMVEPTAMSITPWRSALNSRVWSPWISDTPGYSLMLMRPLVRSRTLLAHSSPPLPQGKAVPSTSDMRYSLLYAVCARAAGR